MSDTCPHRWTHGAMPCEHCGNQDSEERADAVRAELDDWRTFGFALCGPPITCDQDMRDGIDRQLRRLRAILEAYRSLAKAADVLVEDQRRAADLGAALGLEWANRKSVGVEAYDTARATVANLEGEGREG